VIGLLFGMIARENKAALFKIFPRQVFYSIVCPIPFTSTPMVFRILPPGEMSCHTNIW
jgi:predicted membrane protein